MRKVVAGFAVSLDGYIEGANGEYDWITMEPEFDYAGHMKRFDAFFFGRKSYQKLRQAGGISFPGIQHYVFSDSLTTIDDGCILVNGDIKKAVTELKEQPGKDIAVYGGALLLSSLLDNHLVDEIIMTVIPVLLGKGKPMVAGLKERVGLALIETKRFKSGTVQLVYAVGKS